MTALTETPQAGRYTVIYADPAWRYVLHSDAGREKAPDAHYACMDIEAIKALPVGEICGPDAHLFMWTTWAFLPQALEVAAEWSDPDNPWRYTSGGSWHKKTKHGKDGFGPGYTFRTSSEPLLLFSRGAPVWHSKSERNSWHDGAAIDAELREHSRKPDCVREMIERATRGPRLEMFSRSNAEGWDAWGNEAGLFNDPERVAALKAAKAARVARQPSLF